MSQPDLVVDSTEPEPSIGSPSIVPTEELNGQNSDHENDHIVIPTPEDDDFICETLMVSKDQSWSMEIELGGHDILQMTQRSDEEQVALLVSAAEK